MKYLFIAYIFSVLLINQSFAKDCEFIEKYNPQTPFIGVPIIYEYLKILDKNNCEVLSKNDFDYIIDNFDLNLVSYTVFRNRLKQEDKKDYPDLLRENNDKLYEHYKIVNENMIFIIINSSFDKCKGDELCLINEVDALNKERKYSDFAKCIYGSKFECHNNIEKNLHLPLNTKTILNSDKISYHFKWRSEYFCDTYAYCKN